MGPGFTFPKAYRYPPMWTIQPTLSTRIEQFKHWSQIILLYCQHHHIWKLTLVDASESALFNNTRLRKRLTLSEIQEIIGWMTQEEGANRAEWTGHEEQKAIAWIYWKRPEEWAENLAKWVEDTGQKNTVLTLYELTDGDSTRSQEFHSMSPEVLQKTLQVLIHKGKAQIFGIEGEQGVKFF